MDRPTCSTCPYFDGNGEVKGICRARPPRVVATPSGAATWWPEAWPGESCGEHPDFPVFLAETKAEAAALAGPGAPCRHCAGHGRVTRWSQAGYCYVEYPCPKCRPAGGP